MAKRTSSTPDRAIDGSSALTELLARLPAGHAGDAIRAEVARLRRLATQARPRPLTERARLEQAIADADADYLLAKADGSHQAADRSRRHRADLEEQLQALDREVPRRPEPFSIDPEASRVRWLEHHLRECEIDLVYLRRTEQWPQVSQIDGRACELRGELDAARAAAADTLVVDRSPAAVAEQVEARQRRIEELSAAARRMRGEWN